MGEIDQRMDGNWKIDRWSKGKKGLMRGGERERGGKGSINVGSLYTVEGRP